jgi:hypothetical protein
VKRSPLIRRTALKRSTTPVRRRRKGPPRRGRVVDPLYLAWLHTQPGCVCGGRTHSVHLKLRLAKRKRFGVPSGL